MKLIANFAFLINSKFYFDFYEKLYFTEYLIDKSAE
jgi:hypothetical protein